MRNGISVYAGLGYSIEENILLIEKAASLGMSRIFTSVQIPETVGDEKFFDDFAIIIAAGIANNFEIILDVNPGNISDFNLEGLTLRLDDGFEVPQIVELSYSQKIQLNASTVTKEFLTLLANAGANFSNISALHNFYPHLYTGLDTNFFENQNKILHDFGIETGAFIPTLKGRKRPPFHEGLPTLEDCRNFSVDLSARFLAALNTDFIIVSDGLPTDEECIALAEITDNEVIMQAKLLTDDEISAEILQYIFTSRPDVSKSVIRAVEGRRILKLLNGNIKPDNFSTERNFGDVTIDNDNFGRYAGEVQIVTDILPPDSRVNKIASVLNEENFLTGYIKPLQKFSFRLV